MEQEDISVEIKYPKDSKKPWLMDVKIGNQNKQVEVFHCREDSQKEMIARRLAEGTPCVAFGVGLYGLSVVVDDPRRKKNPYAMDAFFVAKLGRNPHAKIPIFISPKDMYLVIDWDAMHPEFAKYLQVREQREKLWREGVAFHLVVPVPKDAHYIHDVLITTPEDLKYAKKPEEQMVDRNTVSAFWWHDPDWEEIADKVKRYNPFGIAGISSFNEHGQQPAYTFKEVIKFIYETGKCPFSMVVRDEIGEAIGVKSSHPQYRVPFKGEPAEWVVVRHGAISIDRWLAATDSPFPARKLISATVAARASSREEDLSDLVFEVRDKTIEDYKRRHQRSWGYFLGF